jgi:acyl carrier protein
LSRQWFDYFPTIPLLNAYGPTECSDDVTHYPMHLAPSQDVINMPIGRPINNMKMYVLDKYLQPVPRGVHGELYVGGVGVGRGYLNDPQRTAEAFSSDPFSQEPGARLYKTGDLVRYLPDGNLEFLGRVDFQVKIRGFRIELGEIEAVLARYPQVAEALVMARQDSSNDKQLVAYLVPQAGHSPSTQDLRAFLQNHLPDYMIPGYFVFLQAFPLNANGKINRKALPAPDRSNLDLDSSYVAPRDAVEETIAKIFARALNVERIGAHDNFFDLGGHSLSATQVISRIRQEFQINFPLRDFFMAPSVAELARAIQTLQWAVQSQSTPSSPSTLGDDEEIIL